jgi:hypothetical protein
MPKWPRYPIIYEINARSWLQDGDRCFIVVNLSECAVQARVHVLSGEAGGETWHLADASSDGTFDRDGVEMLSSGLCLDLEPWDCHFFQRRRTGKGKSVSAAPAGS